MSTVKVKRGFPVTPRLYTLLCVRVFLTGYMSQGLIIEPREDNLVCSNFYRLTEMVSWKRKGYSVTLPPSPSLRLKYKFDGLRLSVSTAKHKYLPRKRWINDLPLSHSLFNTFRFRSLVLKKRRHREVQKPVRWTCVRKNILYISYLTVNVFFWKLLIILNISFVSINQILWFPR